MFVFLLAITPLLIVSLTVRIITYFFNMRKNSFQVVSLVRREVVNLLRPEVVNLNRRGVVNLSGFSNPTQQPAMDLSRQARETVPVQGGYGALFAVMAGIKVRYTSVAPRPVRAKRVTGVQI
jgi:hypothetical protein